MLKPHQQRVIKEKQELDSKITDLSNFILNNRLFKSLSSTEKQLMRDQCFAMEKYSDILRNRIIGFDISDS